MSEHHNRLPAPDLTMPSVCPDGANYYRASTVLALLDAERNRRAVLASDMQEYLYRVASQVPMEHAQWANERGAALLAALKDEK